MKHHQTLRRGLSVLLSLVMCLSLLPAAALADDSVKIEINEENFPDDNFRAFVRRYAQSTLDDWLSEYEINNVKTITCINSNIADLKGIEYFTNLEYLLCQDNQLTTLDVSKNTKLKELSCYNNRLTSLVVSNTALTSLGCSNNQLTTLDVGNNEELNYLYCENNQLTTLDVSENAALQELDCSGNQLTELDVSKNKALQKLDCSGNQLTELDVSNTKLLQKDLDCSGNGYEIELDNGTFALSALPKGFDVNKASNWQGGKLNDEKTTLTIDSEAVLVTYTYQLGLGYTADFALLVKGAGTEINIDAKNFPDPGFRAYLAGREASFDLNRNGKFSAGEIALIKEIDFYDVRDASDICDLTGIAYFTELEVLNCYPFEVTKLDVSKLVKLKELLCPDSPLTTLDVSNNEALIALNCDNNQLTELDISNNNALQYLYCGHNQLTELDVKDKNALQHLGCEYNQLTELDVSYNTALVTLNCSGNQLTTLDISKNTKLEWLYCYNNQLTALDATYNTALTYYGLHCYDNVYEIELDENRSFSLSNLPEGFVVGRTSGWTGGELNEDKTVLTVYEGVNKVTYTYDCGNNNIYREDIIFTLDATPRYTVTFDANGGTVTPESAKTNADGTLSTPPTPTLSGYTFDGWYTEASGGTEITPDYAFSADTTVYAHWTYTGGSGSGGSSSGGSPSYSVTVDKTVNGTVTVSPKSASKGATVTLTVTPDKGYALETLTVTDTSGNKVKLTGKNGKYTFTMPASKVTVKATFMEDNSMLNFFVDVPAGAYYYDAVLWAAENGITGGVDDTHFAPNAPCTRAQIVTFLWRAAGSPEPENVGSFADVSADSYYAKAVAWAVENGITTGTGDGKFSPDATCTRAQAMAFIWRSQKSVAPDGVNSFTDVAADAYYADAVQWAVENGITTGSGDGTTFSPNASCTRAQIVTFLFRCLG